MMTEMEYIKQLEERVERLEKFISKIIIGEGQNISFNDCTLCDIYVSEECNLSFNDFPIVTVINMVTCVLSFLFLCENPFAMPCPRMMLFYSSVP